MPDLNAKIDTYVRLVKARSQLIARGNEQQAKDSLIVPFFVMLGYDLGDPRDCTPEYWKKASGGHAKFPMDWAFHVKNSVAFVVEAKAIDEGLNKSHDQLAAYFARIPTAKLGILTNGVQWRFFTDGEHVNLLDNDPFETWDVLTGVPPYDVITNLQKTNFNIEPLRRRACLIIKSRKREYLTTNDKVHLLFFRNPHARTWSDSQMARELGLSKWQVKGTGAFRRNLAIRKGQELLDDDYAILEAIAALNRRVTVVEISVHIGAAARTIRNKMEALGDDCYLTGVRGDKGGYEITAEGRRALDDRKKVTSAHGNAGPE